MDTQHRRCTAIKRVTVGQSVSGIRRSQLVNAVRTPSHARHLHVAAAQRQDDEAQAHALAGLVVPRLVSRLAVCSRRDADLRPHRCRRPGPQAHFRVLQGHGQAGACCGGYRGKLMVRWFNGL